MGQFSVRYESEELAQRLKELAQARGPFDDVLSAQRQIEDDLWR